jgi:hypothetical protein
VEDISNSAQSEPLSQEQAPPSQDIEDFLPEEEDIANSAQSEPLAEEQATSSLDIDALLPEEEQDFFDLNLDAPDIESETGISDTDLDHALSETEKDHLEEVEETFDLALDKPNVEEVTKNTEKVTTNENPQNTENPYQSDYSSDRAGKPRQHASAKYSQPNADRYQQVPETQLHPQTVQHGQQVFGNNRTRPTQGPGLLSSMSAWFRSNMSNQISSVHNHHLQNIVDEQGAKLESADDVIDRFVDSTINSLYKAVGNLSTTNLNEEDEEKLFKYAKEQVDLLNETINGNDQILEKHHEILMKISEGIEQLDSNFDAETSNERAKELAEKIKKLVSRLFNNKEEEHEMES